MIFWGFLLQKQKWAGMKSKRNAVRNCNTVHMCFEWCFQFNAFYKIFCIRYMILILKSSTPILMYIVFKLECSPWYLHYKGDNISVHESLRNLVPLKILHKQPKHRPLKEHHSFLYYFCLGFTAAWYPVLWLYVEFTLVHKVLFPYSTWAITQKFEFSPTRFCINENMWYLTPHT